MAACGFSRWASQPMETRLFGFRRLLGGPWDSPTPHWNNGSSRAVMLQNGTLGAGRVLAWGLLWGHVPPRAGTIKG